MRNLYSTFILTIKFSCVYSEWKNLPLMLGQKEYDIFFTILYMYFTIIISYIFLKNNLVNTENHNQNNHDLLLTTQPLLILYCIFF